MTAIDNVIAYMEGQGEAKTETKPDLIVFMGVTTAFFHSSAFLNSKTSPTSRAEPSLSMRSQLAMLSCCLICSSAAA